MLTTEVATPIDYLWHKGVPQFLFGLGGLSSIGCLSFIEKQEDSTRSLHDLAEYAQTTPQVDLSLFMHTRVHQLIDDAAVYGRSIHRDCIDEYVLLLTLLHNPRIQMMLARLEIVPDDLIKEVTAIFQATPAGNVNSVYVSPSVRQLFITASQLALKYLFPYVDTEDIFLAYLVTNGPWNDIFTAHRLTSKSFYAVTRWYAEDTERQRRLLFWREKGRTRPSGYMNRAWTALPTPFLDQFSLDLTEMAANGSASVATIRDKEITTVLGILGRTENNNALLLGEPGVGKNAILGAIAMRMIEEDVPEVLKDKRLVVMDIRALFADMGSAEQNTQAILEEVEHAGNVILAIQDVKAFVGTSEGGADAATLLASAVSRGDIQVIALATYGDYHRYIESNPSLAALLQTVQIAPATTEQTIRVLEEETPRIENSQGVFLTYQAIESAVQLAERLLSNHALPESALTVLDEAAALAANAKRRWVGQAEVEEVMEQRTHMPIGQADNNEADALLHMEDILHQHIIGQEDAVHAVAEALRRARAGVRDNTRPISSFLFVGPTGVGKTEMAKTVALAMFGSEERMIRLDMSEYQDNTAVYRLIGPPSGDASDYTEGGSLTQPIRDNPYALLLFDELEKADNDVINLFLQLIDDGRLTENTGRTVSYNNTIIIATSNAGSSEILQYIQEKKDLVTLPEYILQTLQKYFRPELLNRFDAIIPFHPLTALELDQVTALMLKGLSERAEAQGYRLEFEPDTIRYLSEIGFSPEFGARPLRRIIQDKVEGLLARLILERKVQPGNVVRISKDMLQ
jgi:ATP-dependent Clp protease ATP-binding subunit ClpC